MGVLLDWRFNRQFSYVHAPIGTVQVSVPPLKPPSRYPSRHEMVTYFFVNFSRSSCAG